jgi:hypothetical protein
MFQAIVLRSPDPRPIWLAINNRYFPKLPQHSFWPLERPQECFRRFQGKWRQWLGALLPVGLLAVCACVFRAFRLGTAGNRHGTGHNGGAPDSVRRLPWRARRRRGQHLFPASRRQTRRVSVQSADCIPVRAPALCADELPAEIHAGCISSWHGCVFRR